MDEVVYDFRSSIGPHQLSVCLEQLFLNGVLVLAINGKPINLYLSDSNLGSFPDAFLDMICGETKGRGEMADLMIAIDWPSKTPSANILANFDTQLANMRRYMRTQTYFPNELLDSRERMNQWIAHQGWYGLGESEKIQHILSDDELGHCFKQFDPNKTYWIWEM
jgi:hypothetical protein